jgi:hypothetical protein
MKRRLRRLACMLAALLLAGCASDGYYDGGYYDPPPPRYGYGYGYYGYGGYGRPCGWFDDCGGWGHRHHRHHKRRHWDGDRGDDDHHHDDGDVTKRPPVVDRDRHAVNVPPRDRDGNPGPAEPRRSGRDGGRRSSPGPIWLPDTGRDSRR